MAPTDVHVPVLGTSEYTALHRQTNFAHTRIFKSKDLKTGRLLWILGGLNLITWVLKSRKPVVGDDNMKTRQQSILAGSEM